MIVGGLAGHLAEAPPAPRRRAEGRGLLPRRRGWEDMGRVEQHWLLRSVQGSQSLRAAR